MSLDQVPGADPARRIDRVLRLLVAGLSVMMLAVFARVAQLQIAPGESLSAHIQDRVTRRAQPGPRGDILDRRGRLLASTRAGHRVFIDPVALRAPYGEAIARLAEVCGLPPEEVGEVVVGGVARNEQRSAAGMRPLRYIPVGGVLNDEQLEAARRLRIPGVHLERRPVRETPGGDAVASIVGKVGADHEGLLGAERTFDGAVRPRDGHLDYLRDSMGRPMWVEPSGYRPPEKGPSLRLTVDLELQEIASEELRRGVHDADAAGGRLVMIDPLTGEVLAMVDYVRTDLRLAEPPSRERITGRIIEPEATGKRYRTILPDAGRAVHPALARNRCVEDLYEPGSTFKCFVWASLVERGLVAPDEVFRTYGGRWQTDYGRPVNDVTPRDFLTWREVLVFSSNIGMVQGAARLTFEQTRRDILRFGFGRRVGIGLQGESPGIVTPLSRWSKYTQTSIASGYEIGVTPLQIVRGFSAFARTGELAGTLPRLRLEAGGEHAPDNEVRVRVVPAWVANLTRDTLRRVGEMMEQRARRQFPDDPPLRHSIFGKSGTAEIPRPDGRGYFKGQYNSSFLAGAPAEDPRLVIVVVIDDPGPEQIRRRGHYGTAVAGPVVRRVLRRSLEYLGVPPDLEGGPSLAGVEAATAGD